MICWHVVVCVDLLCAINLRFIFSRDLTISFIFGHFDVLNNNNQFILKIIKLLKIMFDLDYIRPGI